VGIGIPQLGALLPDVDRAHGRKSDKVAAQFLDAIVHQFLHLAGDVNGLFFRLAGDVLLGQAVDLLLKRHRKSFTIRCLIRCASCEKLNGEISLANSGPFDLEVVRALVRRRVLLSFVGLNSGESCRDVREWRSRAWRRFLPTLADPESPGVAA